MGILLGTFIVLGLLALGVTWYWQEINEFLKQRRLAGGDADAAALAEELYGKRSVGGADAPEVHEDCRPIERADDRDEIEALHALVTRIDEGLAGDDPAVWPDDSKGIALLAEARALMDEAEQTVERVAAHSDAGATAAGTIDRAVDLMLEAKEHWTSGAACRAALGRAVWLRSRVRRHSYRRMGIVAVLRLANEALEREPLHKEAEVMRARAQVALGKLDAARHALIDLMGRHPDDPDVIRTRSRWLWAHGDIAGAVNAILDLLDRMPGPLAQLERLRIGPGLLALDRFREAAEVYEALRRWRNDLPEVHSGRARCLLDAREFAEAEKAAKQSLELAPTKRARDILRDAMVAQGKGA
jgi:tetratricopeptide (TPR) repeat protein